MKPIVIFALILQCNALMSQSILDELKSKLASIDLPVQYGVSSPSKGYWTPLYNEEFKKIQPILCFAINDCYGAAERDYLSFILGQVLFENDSLVWFTYAIDELPEFQKTYLVSFDKKNSRIIGQILVSACIESYFNISSKININREIETLERKCRLVDGEVECVEVSRNYFMIDDGRFLENANSMKREKFMHDKWPMCR